MTQEGKLYDYGIITKKERIDEPYDEITGRQQSRYYVKYDWADGVRSSMKKQDRMSNPIKDKIRKLYNDFYNLTESYHAKDGTIRLHNNELCDDVTTRGQIDTMLNSPLTMGIVGDERLPEYVKQAINIYNNKINNK